MRIKNHYVLSFVSWVEAHPKKSITLIISIALFQIILFTKALKFDNASQIFIFSNYISQCIQTDIFPYWNPYIQLGSPFYGDLVSRFHYPIIWFFSYTTGYSFFSLHIEFMIIYIGTALGFYQLISIYRHNTIINIAFSIVVSLSGFMLGHAQHLWIVTSLCYFIWNVYFLIKVIQYQQYTYSIPLSISLAFSLLGGYSPMCFIQFYIYIAIFFYLWIRNKSFKTIFILSLSVVSFIILCIGYFYSLWLTFDKIPRTDGVDLLLANNNPFSPLSFITLIHPGFIITDSGVFDTDLSMRSAYGGIFCIPLLIYGLIFLRSKKLCLTISISILFFCFAMGRYTPFRTWLFDWVPFMNYFQYASIFRFVPILALVIINLWSVYNIFKINNWSRFNKILRWFLVSYILLNIILFLYFLSVSNNAHRLFEFCMFITILQLSALLIMCFGLSKIQSPINKLYLFILLIVVDIVGTTQILSPLLVYYRKISVYELQTNISRLTKGFDFIPEKEFMYYSHYGDSSVDSYLVNGNMLKKEPTMGGYDNYKLLRFYEVAKIPHIAERKYIFTLDSSSKVKLLQFSPTKMKANVYCASSDTCYLFQNYFEGWRAKINTNEVSLISDKYFPKIALSKGINKVEFYYEKIEIKYLHYLQMIFLFGLVVLFVYWQFRFSKSLK